MNYSIEKLKAEQKERILSSKIYGDGTTPIPYGIIEILFLDEETGKITRYSGMESNQGKVLILLPFRTPRNLQKFAVYSQRSDWKLKFTRGMMVNAVIENGYVKKLIPSHQFMAPARVLDQETLEVKFVYPGVESPRELPEPKRVRDHIKEFEEEGLRKKAESEGISPVIAAGFEPDDSPF